MSLHLHVFNLRENATNQDLRQLFSGMSIQQDGVTIIGGPKGEAFISFDSELDLLRALKMDGEQHLHFKLATDVDKLKGINQMCMANMQKLKEAHSLFMPGGTSKDDKSEKVQTTNRQQERCVDPSKQAQSCDTSDIDSNYDTKRRRTDDNDNSHIDGGYEKVGLDQYKDCVQSYSQPQTAQAPWLSSHNMTSPYPPYQFQEGPSYPYNSMPLQIPYQHLVGPGLNYPMPEAAASCYPVPAVLPQPKSPYLPSSLLMSLLPKVGLQQYCILVSELPPNVTPGMVWSWVGGPQGTALGVILLKSTNEYPVAFLIYNDEAERDQRLEVSAITVAKFSDIEACDFITSFIRNWTKWKGTQRLPSPIFETTNYGIDRYVDYKTFYNFAKICFEKKLMIPSSEPQKYSVSSNTKEFTETTITEDIKEVQKPTIAMETAKEHSNKMFLVLYQMKPTITATEVQSWFSDGISALKLNFPEKDGPKDSEAMAFILFDSMKTVTNALLGLTGKELVTTHHAFAEAYNMINKYGDKCTITETTSSGRDRIISPEERKLPPFFEEEEIDPEGGEIKPEPSTDQFTLVDSMNMKFLHLKGISYNSTPKLIWNLYPYANGVVIMKKRLFIGASEDKITEATEAIIAFKSQDDLSKAVKTGTWNDTCKRQMFNFVRKFKSQKTISSHDAVLLLSRTGFEMKISTTLEHAERNITVEEAEFIMTIKPIKAAVEADTMSTQSQVTPEQRTSFLYHLKTQEGPMEDKPLYLVLCNMKKELTACQVHALFPDALCALTVHFNGNAVDVNGSKAKGYLLLKDAKKHAAAKLVLENHAETWRYMYAHRDAPMGYRLFQSLKRSKVEGLLACISHKSTISESSPSGVDRVLTLEELAVVPINPPFSLVHDPPCLHYIQLTGDEKYISAAEIWGWLGGRTGVVKGVVMLVRKQDTKEYKAYAAFDSLESCRNRTLFTNHWSSVLEMTEQQLLGLLKRSADDYIIKVSTEMGSDRDLNTAEEELLGLSTKIESVAKGSSSMATGILCAGEQNDDKPTKEQGDDRSAIRLGPTMQRDDGNSIRGQRQCTTTKEQSGGQKTDGVFDKTVQGKSTGPCKGSKRGFYIRLKTVPAGVTTACEILSLFSVEAGHGKVATLVCDCNGVGISAFVRFDEVEHRDSALLKYPCSMRCTAYGRAARLAELGPEYEIRESTESGKDRVLLAEERDGLEKQFR